MKKYPHERAPNVDESARRLEMAMDSAGLAWWDQDFQADRVTRSSNWASMLGYEPADISDLTAAWKDLIHPEDLPGVEEKARLHESGRTPVFEVEHRLRTKAGDWKWILNWGRVIQRDGTGRPLRAVGTHMDITRRKTVELELEEAILRLERELAGIKTLKGIIPVCSHCKKIRDTGGSWRQFESYLQDHSNAEFSHGVCPECVPILYPGRRKDSG
jgi:PAS domain S-box-containing protein